MGATLALLLFEVDLILSGILAPEISTEKMRISKVFGVSLLVFYLFELFSNLGSYVHVVDLQNFN